MVIFLFFLVLLSLMKEILFVNFENVLFDILYRVFLEIIVLFCFENIILL